MYDYGMQMFGLVSLLITLALVGIMFVSGRGTATTAEDGSATTVQNEIYKDALNSAEDMAGEVNGG